MVILFLIASAYLNSNVLPLVKVSIDYSEVEINGEYPFLGREIEGFAPDLVGDTPR